MYLISFFSSYAIGGFRAVSPRLFHLLDGIGMCPLYQDGDSAIGEIEERKKRFARYVEL